MKEIIATSFSVDGQPRHVHPGGVLEDDGISRWPTNPLTSVVTTGEIPGIFDDPCGDDCELSTQFW